MFSAASKTGSQPSASFNYIEDVFSTYLYTGTGSSQTITNDIDLSGKGGLTWIKSRSAATGHRLTDTVRGATKSLESNSTNAQATESTGLTAFGSTGFTIGADADYNTSAATYTSWTFREQAKFFDVVTYTGNGATNRQIAHNLGSAPGMIIVKRTDASAGWCIYHRTQADGFSAFFDTDSFQEYGIFGSNSSQTSSVFQLGASNLFFSNASGGTYVAYLFAHNAGGFGTAGTDNVISCGSFTTDGSGVASVTLGYEPQWVMLKNSSDVGSWFMYDNMRGFGVNSELNNYLLANSSGVENNGGAIPTVTSTGFNVTGVASNNYIYMAIRRGSMKVPTDATKVFTPALTTDDSVIINAGFPVDQFIYGKRDVAFLGYTEDRLRGSGQTLRTNTTGAEVAQGVTNTFDNNTGIIPSLIGATTSMIAWMLRRASGFFDVVCYTGTGTYTGSINHNLGVIPEFCIFRDRASTANWWVYHSGLPYPKSQGMILNSTSSFIDYYPTEVWGGTSTTFITTGAFGTNAASNYVAYLFATCPGVSKVGSYTGTGATQIINCGFTGGARFVLIKRTDSTGDWYVWDTARGMVSGTDPSLKLNSTAVESNANSVYTATTGFSLLASPSADVNTSGGTYIYLAIA